MSLAKTGESTPHHDKDILGLMRAGRALSEDEMIAVMRHIMDGGVNDDALADFLIAMSERGETVDELTGAARVLREKANPVTAPDDAMDCCGTGGDHAGTYNISTLVALICAACGVPVAKHGNRAASSKSGAADVLESLGVKLDMNRETLEYALATLSFCFLMAPGHHQAMRHVAPVRKKLGRRTIFNLLGPLANPAGTRMQLIGVYDPRWLSPLAETLHKLGTERAWIVHGHDGLDEITITGDTDICILNRGTIRMERLSPDSFGLPCHPPEELRGGDAVENARALRDALAGKASAYRDIALANAAAALAIHRDADLTALPSLTEQAATALDSGRAAQILEAYITLGKD